MTGSRLIVRALFTCVAIAATTLIVETATRRHWEESVARPSNAINVLAKHCEPAFARLGNGVLNAEHFVDGVIEEDGGRIMKSLSTFSNIVHNASARLEDNGRLSARSYRAMIGCVIGLFATCMACATKRLFCSISRNKQCTDDDDYDRPAGVKRRRDRRARKVD